MSSLAALTLSLLLAQSQGVPAAAPATTGSATSQVQAEIATVTKALSVMHDAQKVVLGKVQEAREAKDVVKLNCVNEKYTQMTALLRVTEQADALLREALSTRDSDAVTHELQKVAIAGKKVEQLRGEADECIGQLAFVTDENLKVEVVEPENLYDGDPTRPAPPAEPTIRLPPVARPPPASPVM